MGWFVMLRSLEDTKNWFRSNTSYFTDILKINLEEVDSIIDTLSSVTIWYVKEAEDVWRKFVAAIEKHRETYSPKQILELYTESPMHIDCLDDPKAFFHDLLCEYGPNKARIFVKFVTDNRYLNLEEVGDIIEQVKSEHTEIPLAGEIDD